MSQKVFSEYLLCARHRPFLYTQKAVSHSPRLHGFHGEKMSVGELRKRGTPGTMFVKAVSLVPCTPFLVLRLRTTSPKHLSYPCLLSDTAPGTQHSIGRGLCGGISLLVNLPKSWYPIMVAQRHPRAQRGVRQVTVNVIYSQQGTQPIRALVPVEFRGGEGWVSLFDPGSVTGSWLSVSVAGTWEHREKDFANSKPLLCPGFERPGSLEAGAWESLSCPHQSAHPCLPSQ